MMNGWGHFESSAVWEGNVCLAGHNRGANVNVLAIKNLAPGDAISYTTPYGTRHYNVFYVGQVDAADASRVGWSGENLITLITCVVNDPAHRWCVQAREIL
jgi:sortase A